jgi:hypothetical protein
MQYFVNSSIIFTLVVQSIFINSLFVQWALAQAYEKKFLIYFDQSYGFRIQYPSDWKVEESRQNSNLSNNDIVVRFYPRINEKSNNTFLADVAIVAFPFIGNQTVKQLATKAIEHYREALQGFELVSVNNTIFKEDKQSYVVNYLYQDPYFGKFETMQFWTEFENTVFVINYDAKPALYNQYLSTVQGMLTSFEESTNLKGLVSV